MSIERIMRLWAWRVGRKLYCWARGDSQNDPLRNGEYWLIDKVVAAADEPGTMLDIGANKGEWSARVLGAANAGGKQVRLFAFEPCSATRGMLQERLGTANGVTICSTALSSNEGEADFFSNGAGSGTNSLSAASGSSSERVRLTTLDKFVDENHIDHLRMVKIDTEGFDFNVLLGAATTLSRGGVDVVQFEYNWRWLMNKASLMDVFDFIKDKPYRLGKLAGEAIVYFDQWHFELDRYFENNYVLIRRGSVYERLGQVVHFDASNVGV